MSTAVDEQVEESGADVPEPENPDEPETPAGGEPPAEEEPEAVAPEPPMTDKQLEQAFDKLDREAKRHRDRLSEIMGEDALALIPCELCEQQFAGFRLPVEFEPEKVQAVLVALGLTELGEVRDDPEAAKCDRCNGMGVTRTHSHVVGQETRPCTKCGANGWTTPDQRAQYAALMGAREEAANIAQATVNPVPPGETRPAFDAWGRPLGHEFYGKNPDYMSAAELERDYPRAFTAA